MIGISNPFTTPFEWTRRVDVACAFATFVLLLAPSFLLWYRRRQRRCYPMPPGALPFLGHALSLANSDKFLTVLNKWAKDVGEDGTFEFSLFGQRWIVLCSADTIMQAMRMRPYKLRRASKLTDAIASLGIHGLFNAEGHHWKSDRRRVGPALNKNHIEDYFDSIKLVSGRLVSKWGDEKDSVSALTDASKYSLDVVALSIIGMDFDSLNNANHELERDVKHLFQILFMRTLSPVPYWKIPLCGNLDKGKDVSGKVLNIIRDLVQDCRRQKEGGGHNNGRTRKTGVFLQKLIDTDHGDDAKIDEDRVVGNLATLLIAGIETTGTTLAVCLWEVANDSKLQNELYEEIAESGTDMENLTLSDVTNGLPMLHSLLFEVLRVKGPGPFLFFEPGQAIEFQGEALNPGTIICALTRSHGEKAASEVPTGPRGEGPERFCPRRWLVSQKYFGQSEPLELIQPSNKYGGFMPFGHGARVCPGSQLAMAEIITGLLCIMQKFELAPIENHPPIHFVSRFTETFDGEIQLVLKPRVQ